VSRAPCPTYFEVKTWVGLYARHPKEWKHEPGLTPEWNFVSRAPCPTYFEVKTWVGLYARHPKE